MAFRILIWAALGLMGPWACRDEPPPKSAVVHGAVVAPTSPSLEVRKTRFEDRKTITIPPGLPSSWTKFLRRLEAKLTVIEQRKSTHAQDWRGHRGQVLEFRVFGTKQEVEARLLAAFIALKLPGLEAGLPVDVVEISPVTWSVEVKYLRAPVAEPREARVTVRWSRKAHEKGEKDRCRKPKPVQLPSTAPPWLGPITEKRTTRRRIIRETRQALDGNSARVYMLFRNGFAHDEHVGALAAAALAHGLQHRSGTGPRQTWSGSSGEVFSWSPVAHDLDLGCRIEGPVLAIDYERPNP